MTQSNLSNSTPLQLYTLLPHQISIETFLNKQSHAIISSDPGTGKTVSIINDIDPSHKTLILCPKSLMFPVWGEELQKFRPELDVQIATPPTARRNRLLERYPQVCITNYDALLAITPAALERIDTLVIDESSAFSNRSTKRSKIILRLASQVKRIRLLNGTLTKGLMSSLWVQLKMILPDQIPSYYQWEMHTMDFVYRSIHDKYPKAVNKPNIEQFVGQLIKDHNIRYTLDAVAPNLPKKTIRTIHYQLDNKTYKAYKQMKRDMYISTKGGDISAVNATAKIKKLIQIIGDVAYDEEHNPVVLSNQRTELCTDLVKHYLPRRPIVFFSTKAQGDNLQNYIQKQLKCSTALIDGNVSANKRNEIVQSHNDQQIDILLMQYRTASHGLTLLQSSVTIWYGAIYEAESYIQANQRNHRIGQTKHVDVINICAQDTIEEGIYEHMHNRKDAINLLNSELEKNMV